NRILQLDIASTNQGPVIQPAVDVEPAAAGEGIAVDLSAHAWDPDHAVSQLVWTWSGSSHVSVQPGATKDLFTLAPAAGFRDTVTMRLTLTDPEGAAYIQEVFLDWTLDAGPLKTFLKHWFAFREGAGPVSRDSLTSLAFTLPTLSSWSPDTGLTFRASTAPATAGPTTLDPRRGLSFEFWFKSDSLIAAERTVFALNR